MSVRGPTRPFARSQSSKSMVDALDSPERLQEIFASFSNSSDSDEAVRDGTPVSSRSQAAGTAEHEDLEKKLQLSAALGLALLEKQQQLTEENRAHLAKQRELEASVSQLLDRLASSYKENALLIKRAERAQANLDASEASNRQLLVTLEDDRKTLKRLMASRTRQANEAQVTAEEEIELLRREMEQERRRANTAEARVKRAAIKLSDNERRMAGISQQLERARSERAGKQFVAATRNRSRPGSMSHPPGDNVADYIKVIETLKGENELMKADIQQLHDLLDSSRDQIADLQAEQSDMAVFSHLDNSQDVPYAANESLAREGVLSPDSEQDSGLILRDSIDVGLDGLPPTPTYREGSASRSFHHSSDDSKTSQASSTNLPPNAQLRTSQRRRSHIRTGSVSIRRTSGRAMSVDLSNMMMQRRIEDLEHDYQNRPVSPSFLAGQLSPNLRPFALSASVNSYSSSIHSPSLPPALEDSRESDEPDNEVELRDEREDCVQLAQHTGSGLTQSSPNTRRQTRQQIIDDSTRVPDTREVAVQTDAPDGSRAIPSPRPRSSTPAQDTYQASIISSDAMSERDPSEPVSAHGTGSSHARGNRTAALGSLLDFVTRMVTRLKAADIGSLELRLKRQNLPGDVSHLAKATMRDILTEIEGIRNTFRQVLERETSALLDDGDLNQSHLPAEKLMARKDFIALVKIFRDLLYEMGRLRTIVNKVQLEPHLANKLRDIDAIQSPADILNPPIVQERNNAAAALLAPLSRLWYGGEATSSAPANQQAKVRPQSSRLGSSSRTAPKIGASSALAPATVNVEFGRQGGIRRQVSIMPEMGDGGLAGRYQASIGRAGPSNPQGRPPARRDLSGIFAGGSTSLQSANNGGPTTNSRTSSSRHAPSSRPPQRLPQTVDAIIDNKAATGEEEDFHPNLLERTLRPRGLSDSSIHSTFLAHANPAGRLLTPAGLALSSATSTFVDQEDAQAIVRGRTVRPGGHSLGGQSIGNLEGKSIDSVTTSGDGPTMHRNADHADGSVVTVDSDLSPAPTGSSYTHVESSLRERASAASPSSSMNIKGSGSIDQPASTSTSKSSNLGVSLGPSGLFANLGSWAYRTGGGMASSYHESGADRWPGSRSASSSKRLPDA